jgi:hypothetical protein
MVAHKLYGVAETVTTWTDTTGDLALTFNNLAFGAGRQGATLDIGAITTAKSLWWAYELRIQWDTTPIVDELVRLALKRSVDGSIWDNDDGTGNIALSSLNKLKNCLPLTPAVCDEAAADIDTVSRGVIFLPRNIRYVAPIVYNGSAGDNLQATNNVCYFKLWPVPPELQ